MTAGHRPAEVAFGPEWSLDGIVQDAAGRRRTRLRIDRRAGVILAVDGSGGGADRTLDDDALIVPGFVDLHVHCRDDSSGAEHHKEDFGSASRAALHGGVVCMADMPNNPHPPVDLESYRAKRALLAERALVDVVLYGAVTPDRSAFSAEIPYKCYYGPSVGGLDSGDGERTPIWSSYRGHFVAFHAESKAVLGAHAHAATHEDRRPPEAEARAIAEIARLAEEYSFHPHISHLSSAAGLEEIRRARARGIPMTSEVAPHHLFFDRDNRSHFERGSWLQMNPPLRSAADRNTLRDALLRGEIDAFATDHAPHTRKEKARGVSGVPLLDTFGAFLTLLAEYGFPWEVLIERASRTPARLLKRFLPEPRGAFQPGQLASFAVIATRSPWTVTAGDLSTRAGWSPFEGVTFPGRVIMTVVRGTPYDMTR